MFNFYNFFRSLVSFSRAEKIKGLKFSFKHLFIKCTLLSVVLVLILFNHLFFLLDEVFLFVYRFKLIKRPIMIIGAPRTGTTFLFRTLAEDKDNFTCFTMAELIFAPSLIQKYLFYGIYRMDRFFGAPIKKLLLYLEKKTLKSYETIHSVSYFKPEEDEWMLMNIYSSVILKYVFPRTRVFDKYLAFDEEVTPWEKRNIFRFQRRCIKKHLFFWKSICGKEKIFLSKNPVYTPKVDSVFEFYPGLRVIVTSRNLDEVIPSFVSMNSAILRSLHATTLVYPNALMARQIIVSWQETLLAKIKQHNGSQVFECRYERLTANIKEQVEAIYRQFGLEMSEAYCTTLNSRLIEQAKYKSRHRYDRVELNKMFEST